MIPLAPTHVGERVGVRGWLPWEDWRRRVLMLQRLKARRRDSQKDPLTLPSPPVGERNAWGFSVEV
jgi:hypothetical protein